MKNRPARPCWPVVFAVILLVAMGQSACAPFMRGGKPPAVPSITSAVSSIAAPATGTLPAVPTSPTKAFALGLTPLPTETALPTLVLPTELARPGAGGLWDGLPTYLAESRPEFYFRLQFDPNTWALTTDLYGNPALAHRGIADCVIVPVAGRGLPLNGTVDHAVRWIGAVTFQVSTAYINGIKQFVNYAGGDGDIFTSFEVSFRDQADSCLADAEVVLGTLTSIPIFQATPIATP